MTYLRVPLIAAVLLTAEISYCQEIWRLYLGGTGTRWQISHGPQGHAEDCRTPQCDDDDFRRGNLDSSIAFRLGADRPIGTGSGWQITAGTDLTFIPTEYNLSQRDFLMIDLVPYAGATAKMKRFDYGFRTGAGPSFTDDGRIRTAAFVESMLVIPLHEGAAVQFAVRRTDYGRQTRMRDASWMLQLSDIEASDPPGRWGYMFSAGVSRPGWSFGSSRELSVAAQWRHTVTYALSPAHDHRLQLAWSSTEHESKRRTVFQGVSGNVRGITIASVSAAWDRRVIRLEPFAIRLSAGTELAHWYDDHSLLINENGQPFTQGLDLAPAAGIDAEYQFSDAASLVARVEQLYWLGLNMGDVRAHVGVAVRF